MGWNLLPQRAVAEPSARLAAKQADLESSSHQSQPKPTTRIEELKSELKSLLARKDGSTKDPDVVAVVNELAELNPCKENCSRTPLIEGEFIALTCPNFPGRLKPEPGEEHIKKYTLGRMSFNIFQPTNLICTVKSARNPVAPSGTTEDGRKKFTYSLLVDVIIHAPDGDLPAILINEAYCYDSPDVNNRLMVSFTGGTLLPAEGVRKNPAKLDIWSRTFQGAYKKADEERSYFGWAFKYFIKLLLGLTYPNDDSFSEHSFHFEMKRSPVGHLDVLYLDEDLRITKGNRGTIVVVERSTKIFAQ